MRISLLLLLSKFVDLDMTGTFVLSKSSRANITNVERGKTLNVLIMCYGPTVV